MSAFVVEDKTINKIVSYFAMTDSRYYRAELEKLGYDLEQQDGREKLAKDMFALNCQAVDDRYGKGDTGDAQFGGFKIMSSGGGDIGVLKALNCWHYQCTEGESVPNHPLYILLERFAGDIAQVIVSRLPAYDAESWG